MTHTLKITFFQTGENNHLLMKITEKVI